MRPLKKDNDTITLTREQAKNLIKEIAFVAEASFRRGAEHSVAVKLSERDAYFYRRYGQTIDKKLSGSLHVTAYQMPSSRVVGDSSRKRMSSDPAGTFKGYQTWPKVFHDLQSGSREVFTQSSKTEHGQPTLAPTEKPTGNNTGRLRIRNNNNHKSNVSHSADTLMNCKLTETVVNLSDHRANKG